MKKKIFFLVSLLFIFATLIFIYSYQFYKKEIEKNSLMIHNSLTDALYHEVDLRLKNSGEQYSISNVLPDKTIQPDFISFQTEDSVSYIKKKPEYEEKSFPAKNAEVFQTFLLTNGYTLCVNTVDSLLTTELHKKGLYATIGIRYINRQTGERQESKPGDPVYQGLFTDSILLGLDSEMEVQAFYSMPFISLVRQHPISFILGHF